LVEIDTPKPTDYEVLIRVSTFGVCHTELDEIKGRLTPPHLPVILGHEVIGKATDRGSSVTCFNIGDCVGVGWIHYSSGEVDESLSPQFAGTGCDVNGGFAEFMIVPESNAAPIPGKLTDLVGDRDASREEHVFDIAAAFIIRLRCKQLPKPEALARRSAVSLLQSKELVYDFGGSQ